MFLFSLISPQARLFAIAALTALTLAGLLYWGESKYNQGVKDTTQKFLIADLEGAEDVRSTARKVLQEIGYGDGKNVMSDADIDRLLAGTGGLRDDEDDFSGTDAFGANCQCPGYFEDEAGSCSVPEGVLRDLQ